MRSIVVLAGCLFFVSCGNPSGAPIPQPHRGAQSFSVTPSALSLGPGNAASVSASESGTPAFSAQSSDTSVATVASNGSGQFVVTAVNVGSTTITISDGSGNAIAVPVSVQTTIIGGQ